VVFGKIGDQASQVAAQRLGCIGRTGDEFGMNATTTRIRSDAYPSQCGVVKTSFGALRAGMNPRWPPCCSFCIESCEGFAGFWHACRSGRARRQPCGRVCSSSGASDGAHQGGCIRVGARGLPLRDVIFMLNRIRFPSFTRQLQRIRGREFFLADWTILTLNWGHGQGLAG
jgi:hypothetical protein